METAALNMLSFVDVPKYSARSCAFFALGRHAHAVFN